MREADVTREGLFTVRKTSDYVPPAIPLIAIGEVANAELRDMDRLFESMPFVPKGGPPPDEGGSKE